MWKQVETYNFMETVIIWHICKIIHSLYYSPLKLPCRFFLEKKCTRHHCAILNNTTVWPQYLHTLYLKISGKVEYPFKNVVSANTSGSKWRWLLLPSNLKSQQALTSWVPRATQDTVEAEWRFQYYAFSDLNAFTYFILNLNYCICR